MGARPLRRGAVYGPVQSKRLGKSLGINLLPSNAKVCTFDCVYCHYGRTTSGPYQLPRPETILEEVRKALAVSPEVDYVTFAGNGEPTMHMDFMDMVERVVEMRDRFLPGARIALLTNSSKLSRPDVSRACAMIDSPICKLDAGDEEAFRRVNRPRPNIYLEDILRSIEATPNAVVQTMVVEGETGNASDADTENLIAAIQKVHPVMVQVYSIDYPLAEASLTPVPNEKLERIASAIRRKTGIDAQAYWERH